MSEQRWRGFVGSQGVDDWAVLHGGATAVFRVRSMRDAAALAEALVDVLEDEPGVLLTFGSDRLTVRLTRDLWQLDERHVDLARAVSAVARAHDAIADRDSLQEVQLAIAAKPDEIDVEFWRAVLGYETTAEDSAVDRLGHGSTVWMQYLDQEKPLRHAMHVDVSVPQDHVQDRLEAALAAGGRIVDDSEAPRWWTLSDRAGNRVCIAAWPDGASKATPDEPTES